RQPPIWLHVQDDVEIASAPQDRVDRPLREDGQRLQCFMTRLLRFAKLRKRRGEIKASKRSVGWPSTRPGGSVVQADRLPRMDDGTLRVQPDIGATSAKRHPGRIHREDTLWLTSDLKSIEGPLCLSNGQIRLASVAKPGVS